MFHKQEFFIQKGLYLLTFFTEGVIGKLQVSKNSKNSLSPNP